MPATALENVKWAIGLFITLLGAVALWVQLEVADLRQDFQFGRELQFDSEEFNLAIGFRDERIHDLEVAVQALAERVATVEALNAEYRDWVRKLGPRVNAAVKQASILEGTFSTFGHQLAAITMDLAEVKEKQDNVREQLIPNVRRDLDAHSNKPHQLMPMIPNAQ